MVHNYDIVGMHCQSCVGKITTALRGVEGVSAASVTLHPQRARVEMTRHVDTETLNDAVRSAGDYRLSESTDGNHATASGKPAAASTAAAQTEAPENLWPLFLIVGYIAGMVALIAFATRDYSAHSLMNHVMGGFFLVFSFFKFLDLRGFADAYRSYDILARRLPVYGYVYPFLELALGVAYVVDFQPVFTNTFTLVLMLVSSIGVLKTLLDKRSIRCACLGTVLKLPMTKITLVEDLGMAAMAAAMLVLLLIGRGG